MPAALNNRPLGSPADGSRRFYAFAFAGTMAIYELGVRHRNPTRFLFGLTPLPRPAGSAERVGEPGRPADVLRS